MMTLSRWKIIAVVVAAIFGVLFSVPNMLSQQTLDSMPGFFPRQQLNLGLDLQGGSHLLLEVDTEALRAERLVNTLEDTRVTLNGEGIAFSELRQQGGEITLRTTDPAQRDAAVQVLRNTLGVVLAGTTGGRDITVRNDGATGIRIAFVEEAMNAEAAKAVEQSIEIIRRRIDELGTREPTIIRQGIDRIVVQAPGESDPERLKNVIGQTAKLTFQMVDEGADMAAAAEGRAPPGSEVLPSEDGFSPFVVVRRRALVSGEMLTDASQGFDAQTGEAVVNFRFNSIGARRFGEATAQNIGQRFAIVLDGKVISAPVIRGAITGGSGQISGSFTPESANDLAVLLRAGALPAPLTVEEQRTVGAELGADAVRAGQISTGIAFVTILVFMVVAYGGLFGGISVVALLVNALLIFAIMSLTQATLTLPGIAGLILTLAVAVDANVLIYERMRDEIRAGRTAIAAMDAGFSKAMSSIIDANVTTILAALIMFQFGSGPVRGFAWTLSIGVVTSVFTAVLVTQVLLALWFRATRPKTLPIV
ncbi:MAG: protein translocase subunit SecD [Phenylobacterium sp.]|uniref:protein translocase subunit SecD n=1 Tax=Phenylobacterium sp. TaxID=1871053 RepID=UPI002733E26A|nr:protein translocase subunit SecD [Phenylobacterium sp.]MDP1642520.1 protein translocase subunit SecD [Phenylobacterium sp.]MDP3117518.1 protein translocase subunit SecD [Phenylobacterium sp.]